MPRSILVVDDNEVERTILCNILSENFNVISAESGREMISFLREKARAVSAIVLDLVMPEMDGYEALQKIQENAVYRQIPVIIATALNDEESQVKAMRLGASGYIVKPFNKDLLKYTLNSVINLREKASIVNAVRNDSLTGIFNRKYFFSVAEGMIGRKGSGYYILSCFNIENFKVINDQYGAETGDEVLKYIAKTINEYASQMDGICCRFSADKFGMLYPAKYKDTALIPEFHDAVTSTKHLGSSIKIRIGRYTVSDTSMPVSAMYDRATMAEESIKGRYNTYAAEYDEAMRERLLNEQNIVNNMHVSLSDGEFLTFLQPQYNHATGAIIGAEALVRWKKDDTFISPSEFIPIFERNGFIYEMDQYIWEDVCKLLRSEIDRGLNPLPISVNISRRDLFQKSFIEKITGIIKKYDLPFDLLRLEVTESAFSDSTKQIINIVNELIKLGFTVEIDDFGSGYSSLNTLKDVPASILKLDMHFFENTENSERGGNIVESVVRMAKWLGMAVIAEGVEEKEQADYLKTIGCYYIQGYYYAKPMPVCEYEELLTLSRQETKLSRLETLENLNNNKFWNPKSMETLIFNSFVGAATILEYRKGKIEMLRASENFVGILNSTFLDIKTVLTLDWAKHLDERSLCIFLDAIAESFETKQTVTKEYEFTDLPGCTHKTYLRSAFRVLATTGDRTLIYCINENITAQRNAEIQSQKNAFTLQAVMDNISCGVSAVISDHVHTEFVFVNDAFFGMLGYTREQYEAEVKMPYDIIHPDDEQGVRTAMAEIMKNGGSTTLEYRIIKRDKSVMLIRNIISKTDFTGIEEPVYQSIYTDITKQHSIEFQLRAIIDNINGGVSATVIKNGKPEFVVVNDRFFEILGYESREQYERELPDKYTGIHPDDRERIVNQFESCDGGKNRYTMEYRIIRRDSEIRYIRNSITVMDFFGIDEPVQLSVATDITELRMAELETAILTDRLKTVTNSMSNGMTAIAIRGNETEFLFANDRYYEMHGITREEYQNKYLADSLMLVYPDDREKMCKAILSATKVGTQIKEEYRILRPDGTVIWTKAVINATTLVGIDVPVQVTIFTDITEEKEANSQLEFLNTSAHDILAQTDANSAINITLEKMIDYFEGDRAYVIELDYNTHTSHNTYELCADGIIAQKEKLQVVPFTKKDFWYKSLSKNELFVIEDVEKIREKEKELYALLSSQDIHSIILAPLFIGGKLVGFCGVDNPKKDLSKVSGLKALGDYFALLIGRRNVNAKILNDANEMKHLINDTPGGFMRMEIHADKNPTIISLNEGICRMLDMSQDEIMQEYGNDVYKCILPEDITPMRNDSADAIASCGQFESRCRIRRKDGELMWVKFNARSVKDENGRRFLNSFYSDITEQKKSEELQIELLDNLAFGAALYEFDGKEISVIHINKRYWELVERKGENIKDISVLNAVHPDDVDAIRVEIASAVSQGRNVEADVRVLCGESGYKPFHVTAVITKKGNNKYLLYASYAAIPEQVVNFKNALPFIFSTIMESSTDLAFAKDRSFKYMCASKTFLELVGLKSEKEVIGKTDYELFPKEIADKFRRDDSDIFASKKPQTDVSEIIPSTDGRKHYTKTSKYLLKNLTGEVVGIYGIGRDITEVREAYKQLTLLTNSISGGLGTFCCTPEKIDLTYYNDGLCEISGYSREEFQNEKIDPLTLVFDEDKPCIYESLQMLYKNEAEPVSFMLRIHTKNGDYKWTSCTANVTDSFGDTLAVNAVFIDITEQQEEKERLRLQEEEYRLVTEHANRTICRYDIKNKTLIVSDEASNRLSLPKCIQDVPCSRIKLGLISEDTESAYTAFYERIIKGEKRSVATFCMKLITGWRWIEARATTIFDKYQNAVSAVISFTDATEQQEKEAVYKKWKQNLESKEQALYSLFRVNLNKNGMYDTKSGVLFDGLSDLEVNSFNEIVSEFVDKYVFYEDRAEYIRFVNSDTMLASYYRGIRADSIEFRFLHPNGMLLWIRLSVELVEYPNSTDILSYLLFEDITAEKKSELQLLEKAETDPLTGILNRSSFEYRANQILSNSKKGTMHALIMIDVDGFKLVNDLLGHSVGDETLTGIADILKRIIRKGDLVGRLGGDEFIVLLSDIPSEEIAEKKAGQICSLTQEENSGAVRISVSAGIAVSPQDGNSFHELYQKADKALYYVKKNGKNNFALSKNAEETTEPE